MGSKAAYVRGTCETLDKKERLSIMWFDRYIYETVNMLVNKEIVVGGEVFCGEKGIRTYLKHIRKIRLEYILYTAKFPR